MPGRLMDFIYYWRSRGLSIRTGYRLWQVSGIALGQPKRHFQPADFRWAAAN